MTKKQQIKAILKPTSDLKSVEPSHSIPQDLEIIKALLFGSHLEPKEVLRAKNLVFILDLELKARLTQK